MVYRYGSTNHSHAAKLVVVSLYLLLHYILSNQWICWTVWARSIRRYPSNCLANSLIIKLLGLPGWDAGRIHGMAPMDQPIGGMFKDVLKRFYMNRTATCIETIGNAGEFFEWGWVCGMSLVENYSKTCDEKFLTFIQGGYSDPVDVSKLSATHRHWALDCWREMCIWCCSESAALVLCINNLLLFQDLAHQAWFQRFSLKHRRKWPGKSLQYSASHSNLGLPNPLGCDWWQKRCVSSCLIFLGPWRIKPHRDPCESWDLMPQWQAQSCDPGKWDRKAITSWKPIG